MDRLQNASPAALIGVAILAGLAAVFLFSDALHLTSRTRSEIIDLRLYPIKSCRGIQVKSARLLKTGLDLDRNWMFVSAENREFITIRGNSQMTLIRTAVDFDKDNLTITLEGNKDFSLVIPAHPTQEWLEKNTQLRKGIIWGQETDGFEYAKDLTQPISDFLGMDVRLLYKGPTPRVLRGCGAPDHLGRKEATKFADMMPVLVSSMSSITELNQRLRRIGEEEISIERFRPNIVIRGGKPWSEDNWKTVRVNAAGDDDAAVTMDVVCRCLRCQVPNVDPDTAEKNPRQPWDLLTKYRRIDPGLKFKPSFGMLCVPREEGVVTLGKELEVTGTTNDHFFISPMK
ncbi:Mitochondrial amidoxime-reducing component 1 [Paramyrothecium foliicola]|nr:Mitochondrial amidoxime-reducing component 1 [Paramyrothecium foliicola]